MTICRLVTAAEEPARRERYAAEPRWRSALKQGLWLARWTRAEKRQATRRQRAGGRIAKFAARGSDTGLGAGGLPVRWAWAWALQKPGGRRCGRAEQAWLQAGGDGPTECDRSPRSLSERRGCTRCFGPAPQRETSPPPGDEAVTRAPIPQGAKEARVCDARLKPKLQSASSAAASPAITAAAAASYLA